MCLALSSIFSTTNNSLFFKKKSSQSEAKQNTVKLSFRKLLQCIPPIEHESIYFSSFVLILVKIHHLCNLASYKEYIDIIIYISLITVEIE